MLAGWAPKVPAGNPPVAPLLAARGVLLEVVDPVGSPVRGAKAKALAEPPLGEKLRAVTLRLLAAKRPGSVEELRKRVAKLPQRAAKLPQRVAKLPQRVAKRPQRVAKLPPRAAKLRDPEGKACRADPVGPMLQVVQQVRVVSRPWAAREEVKPPAALREAAVP